MDLVVPQHVGSSLTRARTRVPCVGRLILNHCTTREVQKLILIYLNWLSPAQSDVREQPHNVECCSHHLFLVYPVLLKHIDMHKYIE